ncbi:viral A-type inclusion protein [Spirosoma foliorum]|uniref:Viral A-type inclusion protein n=1 Tax=Spirosoma foliorum TaxID=2710596 RepID=A0A7G5H609_9BACT|nr:viral A-type inclusion protein [Spirosoma foliorum]QMW06551.1 viral A-type inclusion protein [Spirosoma foliorum]
MNKTTQTLAILVALSGAFWSCNSGEEAVKKAENEVFAIHDEIMPKVMGDLVKLKKQLNQRGTSLDSLKANGSAAATVRVDEEKAQVTRLNQDLLVADSLMNNWMAQYNGDTLAKLSSDEALNYLAAQKDQITDVKKKVNTSIEQAKQFLEKK